MGGSVSPVARRGPGGQDVGRASEPPSVARWCADDRFGGRANSPHVSPMVRRGTKSLRHPSEGAPASGVRALHGEGRRVELVVRPNGGAAVTTTFRYQGGSIAQELTGGTIALWRIESAGTLILANSSLDGRRGRRVELVPRPNGSVNTATTFRDLRAAIGEIHEGMGRSGGSAEQGRQACRSDRRLVGLEPRQACRPPEQLRRRGAGIEE